MRLGLLGGTFDPVHTGHLTLAETCRKTCKLDEVWFVPTGCPPHKVANQITPASLRMEMLELALADNARFSVSNIEVQRTGTTYTVETLQQLVDEDPQRELFFLIGADSLFDLPNWREPERIARLATLVAANRSGERTPDLSALPTAISERVQIVSIPEIDISSSEIRERVRNGKSIRFMVPPAVETCIQQRGLYRKQ